THELMKKPKELGIEQKNTTKPLNELIKYKDQIEAALKEERRQKEYKEKGTRSTILNGVLTMGLCCYRKKSKIGKSNKAALVDIYPLPINNRCSGVGD
ncbi:hypothetical protein, partial [Escherichia coli]|uniref:hypothetical protein n=1 Tax=Escherichia coli TaxID=562 RepID=UPI003B9D4345